MINGTSQKGQELGQLNREFRALSIQERIRSLYAHYAEEEILVTSSFGTQSAYLLYQISQVRPSQPIHFIDTHYHFGETLDYKSELSLRFGLNIVDIQPEQTEHRLTTDEEWWVDHPRMCCAINKIAPLNRIKGRYRVWMSGLMSFQTRFREGLDIFEDTRGIVKFHPLIDLDEGQFMYDYGYYNLPRHPLADLGYHSIGCTHCTIPSEGRDGRWAGKVKTECGLHYSVDQNRLVRHATAAK
jgi:phosphoadenosine phosphosulfate reductase